MKYRLKEVMMKGNKHGQLKKDMIYAELVDEDRIFSPRKVEKLCNIHILSDLAVKLE